jgi:hypothetical protein
MVSTLTLIPPYAISDAVISSRQVAKSGLITEIKDTHLPAQRITSSA